MKEVCNNNNIIPKYKNKIVGIHALYCFNFKKKIVKKYWMHTHRHVL
jgi:hypothetical protein